MASPLRRLPLRALPAPCDSRAKHIQWLILHPQVSLLRQHIQLERRRMRQRLQINCLDCRHQRLVQLIHATQPAPDGIPETNEHTRQRLRRVRVALQD